MKEPVHTGDSMKEFFRALTLLRERNTDWVDSITKSTMEHLRKPPAMPTELPVDRRPSDIGWYWQPHPEPWLKHTETVTLCASCARRKHGEFGCPESRAANVRPWHREDLALAYGPGPWSIKCDLCGRGYQIPIRATEAL